jgi:hypothetical protein
MLIRRHDAPTTIVPLTSSLSNSNAASGGFRVSSATPKLFRIHRQFGLSVNSIRPQFYAAVADINYPSQNTSIVIRSAQSVITDSIRDAPAIAIFILNLRARMYDLS